MKGLSPLLGVTVLLVLSSAGICTLTNFASQDEAENDVRLISPGRGEVRRHSYAAMPIPLDLSTGMVDARARFRRLPAARPMDTEKTTLPLMNKTPIKASRAKAVKQAGKHQPTVAKTPSANKVQSAKPGPAGNLTSLLEHKLPVRNATRLGSKNKLSHTDRVMQHLQQNNHISWTRLEGGAYTVIPVDKWQLGVKHVKNTFNLSAHTYGTKHILPQPLPLFLPGNGTKSGQNLNGPAENHTSSADNHALQHRDSAGFVGGYEVDWYSCYNDGSKSAITQIAAFAPHACDVLLHMPTDPKNKQALKVFQTKGVPNAAGRDSYIRFSTQLTKGDDTANFATQAICEATLAKFDTVCQNGPGAYTQGGELSVAGAVKFNADPTQVDCNC
ncbi:hypothetical protein MMC32_001762 [Xylographa parallela]|nr:hypothetical protein [Xylographa parallela]